MSRLYLLIRKSPLYEKISCAFFISFLRLLFKNMPCLPKRFAPTDSRGLNDSEFFDLIF